jgi:hypothetical protein
MPGALLPISQLLMSLNRQSALQSRTDEPGHVGSRLTQSRVSGRKAPAFALARR